MCKWGTDESIVIEQMVAVDACVAPLIVAFNQAGIYTRNCCCGHLSGEPCAIILDSREHPGVPTAEQRARELGLTVGYTDNGLPEIRLTAEQAKTCLAALHAAAGARPPEGETAEPTEGAVLAIEEVLIRMGLAGGWPAVHLRATASMCVKAAAAAGHTGEN